MEGQHKRCKSQWSAKYRSRSLSKGTCRVSIGQGHRVKILAESIHLVCKIWSG